MRAFLPGSRSPMGASDATLCPPPPHYESPLLATAGGCLVILLAIVVQLEVSHPAQHRTLHRDAS